MDGRLRSGPLKLSWQAIQDIGARAEQQDSYCVRRFILPQDREEAIWTYTFLIADGMGGHNGGRDASTAAIEGFISRLNLADEFGDELLGDCLESANQGIAAKLQSDSSLAGMGTTFIGAVIRGGFLHWVSVGDSLLLLASEQELRRVNADHSMAPRLDEMARAGEITPDEAKRDPRRNSLLDALRGQPLRYVDDRRQPIKLVAGDRLLIATDGVASLSFQQIFRALSANKDDDPAAIQDLMKQISDTGDPHQDNVSCIIVTVHDD